MRTREEAHEEYDDLWSVEAPPVDDVVDEIYDGMHEEITKLLKETKYTKDVCIYKVKLISLLVKLKGETNEERTLKDTF